MEAWAPVAQLLGDLGFAGPLPRARPVMGPKRSRLCSSSTVRGVSLGTRPEYSEKPPPQQPPNLPDATSFRVRLSTTMILGDLALGWKV